MKNNYLNSNSDNYPSLKHLFTLFFGYDAGYGTKENSNGSKYEKTTEEILKEDTHFLDKIKEEINMLLQEKLSEKELAEVLCDLGLNVGINSKMWGNFASHKDFIIDLKNRLEKK